MSKYLTLIFLILLPGFLPAKVLGINDTLKRAAALEASGDLDNALGLYRALYAHYPRRVDILFRLQNLLSRMGQHDQVVPLLRARLKRVPRDITALLRLGDALYALGRQDEAFETWDRIPEGATASGPYSRAASRYKANNLYARSAATYRKAREALGPPHLFARELAELAERQAQYPEAVSEYLLYLQEKPKYLPLIASRFRKFAREGDDQEKIVDLLAEEVRKHPDDNVRLTLLTEYALSAGYAGYALQVLTEHLGETHRHRILLFQIASHALKEGDYTTAVVAYQTLIGRFDRSKPQPRALLGLARAEGGRGRPDQARRLYRDLIDRYPNRLEADEARYRLGRLLHEAYQDSGRALQTFQALVEADRRTPWRYRALFDIAEAMLLSDRFAEAKAACVLIVQERRGHQEADDARLRIAECHFLAGDFDAAEDLLDRLLSGSTARYALNDALALSVLIQDGRQGDPNALKAYAAVLRLKRQQKSERALGAFQDWLKSHPKSALLDRALAQQVELLEALERYPEAIGACRRLISDVPWSPLCPWAQMALARIYGERLGQVYDALNAYETLLIEYPQSLEADTARDRLKALQKKIEAREASQKETG